MSSDNTKIVKNSLILYVKLITTSLIQLVSVRIVLRGLGVSDYGLYSVVGGIVVMLNLLNTTLISTTYRYIAFEMGKADVSGLNKVFNISLTLHLCLAGVVVIFIETLGIFYVNNYLNVEVERIPDAIFVLRMSTLAAVFSILSVPFQGLVTAKENFLLRASIEILSSFLRLGVDVLLIY